MSDRRVSITKVKCLATMKRALERAGFETAENVAVQLYGTTEKAALAFKEKGAGHWQLGFHKKGSEYQLFGDFHMYAPKCFKKLSSKKPRNEEMTERLEALYQLQATVDYAASIPGWQVTAHSKHTQVLESPKVFVDVEQTA